MHITFVFTAAEQGADLLRLPSANLHIFQSMLYSLLPPDEATFLHDEGYEGGGQKMKLYAMSWPIAASRPVIQNRVIAFPMPVRLVVSTPLESTADNLIAGATQKGKLRLRVRRKAVNRHNARKLIYIFNIAHVTKQVGYSLFKSVKIFGHKLCFGKSAVHF